jgi:hypothetical protein
LDWRSVSVLPEPGELPFILSRGHPYLVLEYSTEMALIGEPGRSGDLTQGYV